MRHFAIALLIACAALGGSAASRTPALAATTLYVATTGTDSGNDCQTQSNPCSTITYAIGVATAAGGSGDTIMIAGGTYQEHLSVSIPLTLQGAGAEATIVDGGASPGTVVGVSAPSPGASIVGLTIQHGQPLPNAHGNADGGGIANNGVLLLVSSMVLGNVAQGGASTSTGNGGLAEGGGIWNEVGATLTVKQSTVADNHATGGNASNGGTNGGTALGGGIENEGTLSLIDSTVADNVATGGTGTTGPAGYADGAGIESEGTATIENVTIAQNHATSTASSDTQAGGGLDVNGGTATLTNTIVATNTSSQPSPDCAGTLTSGGHNLIGDAIGCSFIIPSGVTGDQVGGDESTGGAPIDPLVSALDYHGGTTETLTLHDSSVFQSASRAIGKGDDTVCAGADVGDVDQRGFTRPDGSCDIGAFDSGATTGVPGVTTEQVNDCADAGSVTTPHTLLWALALGNTITFTCSGTIVLSAPLIVPWGAILDGGGKVTISGNDSWRVLAAYNAQLTLRNLTISHGRSDAGAGVYIYHGYLTLSGVTMTANEAIGANGAGVTSGYGNPGQYATGGAIDSEHSVVDITSSTITDNRAQGGAGGAGGSGAATSSEGGQGADGGGGGIFSMYGTITVRASVISRNIAAGGAGGAGGSAGNSTGGYAGNAAGAGLYAATQNGAQGSIAITATTLAGNQALGGAGGQAGSPSSCGGCTVYYQGGSGGGVAGGAIYALSGPVTLDTSTLSGNTARAGNGGLGSVVSGQALGDGGTGGEADGGGIWSSGLATVRDTTIAQNSTIGGNGASSTGSSGGSGGSASGGGLDIDAGSAGGRLTAATVAANTARGGSGGTGATQNGRSGSAQGGGIWGPATLANTILAGNMLGAGGQGIDCYGSLTTGGHNLIGQSDNSACTGFTNGASGDQVGTPAGPRDPRLGPLRNNGGSTQTMALLQGSPAIGAGDTNTCAATFGDTDQRGDARNSAHRAACDIGAYDSGGAVPIVTGWNLLDLVLQQANPFHASDLRTSIDTSLSGAPVTAIATYVGGSFHLFLSGYTVDQTLGPAKGIFVLSTKAGSWTPTGSAYSAAQGMSLSPGWNLAAAPDPQGGLDGGSIGGSCGLKEVATFVDTGYRVYTPSGGPASFHVNDEQGMWIECSSAANWLP